VTSQLADAVGAVSPLRGRSAIDGSARPKTRSRKTPAEKGIYEGWVCPRPDCKQEVPADVASVSRHLNAHMNALAEERDALGPDGVRTEFDELGHVMVYGPGNAGDYPIVFLRWDELLIDPGIQRDREDGHPLMARGVRLDYRKTEALTVAAVRIAKEDGEGSELLGYRPIEGQHRIFLGQDQDPKGLQPCKIVTVESRQEESSLGRMISLTRSPFAKIAIWRQLEREGQPNIVACAGLLKRGGYTVSVNGPERNIAAAGALLKIAGLHNLNHDEPEVTKDPQEAARDMAEVLTAIEGIAAERGEGNKRYNGTLLELVASIIADNREVLIAGNHGDMTEAITRLATALGTRTAADWLKLGKDKEFRGGKARIRELMCKAYSKGKQKYVIT